MAKARRGDKKEEVRIIRQVEENSQAEAPKPKQANISFDQWWLETQTKFKLKPALKEAVRKHLQARGFMENGEYDKGLSDFGLDA